MYGDVGYNGDQLVSHCTRSYRLMDWRAFSGGVGPWPLRLASISYTSLTDSVDRINQSEIKGRYAGVDILSRTTAYRPLFVSFRPDRIDSRGL